MKSPDRLTVPNGGLEHDNASMHSDEASKSPISMENGRDGSIILGSAKPGSDGGTIVDRRRNCSGPSLRHYVLTAQPVSASSSASCTSSTSSTTITTAVVSTTNSATTTHSHYASMQPSASASPRNNSDPTACFFGACTRAVRFSNTSVTYLSAATATSTTTNGNTNSLSTGACVLRSPTDEFHANHRESLLSNSIKEDGDHAASRITVYDNVAASADAAKAIDVVSNAEQQKIRRNAFGRWSLPYRKKRDHSRQKQYKETHM